MRLYLLTRRSDQGPVYDSNNAMVVRATSTRQARYYASQSAMDEGRECWLNPADSKCELLIAPGEPGVIIRDFNAG